MADRATASASGPRYRYSGASGARSDVFCILLLPDDRSDLGVSSADNRGGDRGWCPPCACDDAGVPGDVIAFQDRRHPRRVVTTFTLPPNAWDHLAGRLGDRIELVDVRAADGQEDAVLVPSTSRQLIGKISAAFPRAVVLVVEVEDPSYGVELGGQVMRSLDAGADGYYLANSLDQLAAVVDHAFEPRQIRAERQPTELAPPPADELSSILDRLIHTEAAAERREPQTRGRKA